MIKGSRSTVVASASYKHPKYLWIPRGDLYKTRNIKIKKKEKNIRTKAPRIDVQLVWCQQSCKGFTPLKMFPPDCDRIPEYPTIQWFGGFKGKKMHVYR